MSAESIATALGGASRKANGGFMATCPVPDHDDSTASLSIDEKDGKLLYKCFAGCTQDAVLSALEKQGLLSETERPAQEPRQKRKLVATYDYRDASGVLLFQAIRYTPKGFSQRRPDGEGGWINNLDGIEIVPYNLAAVLQASYVAIVEGEKDVDRLTREGITASCNAMGAGKWREGFNQHFAGKHVAIIPDNDDPGRKHALDVAQNLHGIAQSVRVVELPGLPVKGDASDWLDQHGNDKERLLETIGATPEWTDPNTIPFDLSRLKTGADILAGDYHFRYAWEKMFPEGAIILFYGQGGFGKSTLARQVGHAISKGEMFLGLRTDKRPVVLADYENPMTVLKKGLTAIGQESNVYYWTISDEPPQLDKDEWEQLKSLVTTLRNPLLIFDTLQSATFSLDITSNADYSPVMNRLKQLRELGATIVILLHTVKADATKYVGASVIFNQVDHVLALYPIDANGKYKEPATNDADLLYRFGSKDKTRYGHHSLHIKFNKDTCLFQLATTPDLEEMKILAGIISDIHRDTACNFRGILDALENQECLLDISEKNIRRLLKKGDGVYWQSRRGLNNVALFEPLENGFSDTCEEKDPQSQANTGFGGFSDPLCQTAKPHEQGLRNNGNEAQRLLTLLWTENDYFDAGIQ